VSVEPGIVLDRLNAWLRPHGLWFPVDVSTSAQATIGGMAGNMTVDRANEDRAWQRQQATQDANNSAARALQLQQMIDDLRRQAALICQLVGQAARFAHQRPRTLERLVMAVEALKTTIYLAKEVQAFASFAQFQRIVELAVLVGKQSGGWFKQAAARPAAPMPAPGADAGA